MHIQYTRKSQKWCPKTSKSVQNEVPRGTWSHQNNEKVEKVKSHENSSIYCTFERLDHQKPRDFPIKMNQNSCMQSKQAFVHFKSQIIWKSNPKWSPEADPKSIKNHEKSILGPSRAPWASRGGSGRVLAPETMENLSILVGFCIIFRCRNRWQIWFYVLRCWYRSRCRNGFALRFWADGFVDSVVDFRCLAGSRFDGANDEADGNTDGTTRWRDGGANAEADGTKDATTRCGAA